jgi:hypothetical protein
MVQSVLVQQAVSATQVCPHGLKPELHAMPHEWLVHRPTPFAGVGQSVESQHCCAPMHVSLHSRWPASTLQTGGASSPEKSCVVKSSTVRSSTSASSTPRS